MENFTREDLSDAFNAGATRMYHDLNLGNGNPPEFEQWFEKFSLHKDHPTTSSGSVAAPKDEEESLHDQLNTEQHLVRVYKKQLECVRQQLKEREEALKELLPIAENYRITVDNPDWKDEFHKVKAIIEKARKLISK